MGRNRSKFGKLASECPDRISKFVCKYRKIEAKVRDLKRQLKLPAKKQTLVYEDGEIKLGTSVPNSSEVSIVIEFIKQKISILKSEARSLEKKLGISRKNSDLFGGKNHRSGGKK